MAPLSRPVSTSRSLGFGRSIIYLVSLYVTSRICSVVGSDEGGLNWFNYSSPRSAADGDRANEELRACAGRRNGLSYSVSIPSSPSPIRSDPFGSGLRDVFRSHRLPNRLRSPLVVTFPVMTRLASVEAYVEFP